uniref:NR LBD domain-containing protein n=1 Tax=Gongylonema pulchrum TaxID=637853 RepID=A0A183E0Q3_9BILA
LDELLSPLRRINIEKAEISALKALVLLHPDVMGLTITSREKLRDARDGVLRALFAYLRQMLSPADASVRLSNLLLVIPSVYSIAQNLAQSNQLGVLFGLTDRMASASNKSFSATSAISDCMDEASKDIKENVDELHKDGGPAGLLSPTLLASLVASQAISAYGNLQAAAPALNNPAALPVSR